MHLSLMPVWRRHNLLKGPPMSKTGSFVYVPSPSLFSRVVALVDRVLDNSANISLRNNDLPYFGL